MMEYGTGTEIVTVNRIKSLRLGPVIGSSVAMVELSDL